MDILYKWREHQAKLAKKAESARKKQVEEYKKEIRDKEEALSYFYKNQLDEAKISNEEYAALLKDQSDRYKTYSKETLRLSFLTEKEKLLISQEYTRKSEQLLHQRLEFMKDVENEKIKQEQEQLKEQLKAEREQLKKEKERLRIEKENLDNAMSKSSEYVSDRNYSSDWADFGDTPEDAFSRVDQRLSEAVLNGIISYEEYIERLRDFGADMYEDRIANSNSWLSHEREMNRISAEDYIAGLYRMKDYTQEYYSKGMISHRQYIDGLKALDERIFNERVSQHKEILRQADKEKASIDEIANSKIDALRIKYEASITAMDSADREEELSYLKAQEKIYASSKTREGKERLNDIREKIDQINDEKRRAALKEDFESSKEEILASAEEKKKTIDLRAKFSAFQLGLSYDEESGYHMVRHVNKTLEEVIGEQISFSDQSSEEMKKYNTDIIGFMADAIRTLSENILNNFRFFSDGIDAIKDKIFADVASVNSLDFSRFGSSSKSGNTTITYNDYGDKKITGGTSSSFFDTLSNLIAKGGKI